VPRPAGRRGRAGPVALATGAAFADLPENRVLAAALAGHGVTAEPAVWSDPGVRWARYRAVVIRSCWDYHRRLDDFLAWVDALGRERVTLWNARSLVRWNARKRYLADLAARGVAVAPTVWLAPDDAPRAAERLAGTGWSHVVLKPEVSSSAHDTWAARLPLAPPDAERLDALLRRGAALVQPYLSEIPERGEHCLVFVDGRFSHAIVRRAAPGDFRVQREYGGTVEPVVPSSGVQRWAEGVLRLVRPRPLYARVDAVLTDGGPCLMELELIEPSLYFDVVPEGAERLAAAIRRRIR
jgi:glutathione synthase/RimK-type ligase-like ATP-grasp enzyme